MRTSIGIFLIFVFLISVADASWLSSATRNVGKTATKAANDIGREADRAKKNVSGSGSKEAVVAAANKEIDESAQALVASAQETIDTQAKLEAREKELKWNQDLLKTGILGYAGTCLIGVIALMCTTIYGRHDRRLRLLEAIRIELQLRDSGFDLKTIPNYKPIALQSDQSRDC